MLVPHLINLRSNTFTALRCIHEDFRGLYSYGDAKMSESYTLVLTSGIGHTSAAFFPSPVRQEQSFRFQMRFRLIAPPGAGEADGIAVVFSPVKKMGLGGYGLGYTGLGGQGDFAVESGSILRHLPV